MRKWVYKQAYSRKNFEERESVLVIWWRKIRAWWDKKRPREEESTRG